MKLSRTQFGNTDNSNSFLSNDSIIRLMRALHVILQDPQRRPLDNQCTVAVNLNHGGYKVIFINKQDVVISGPIESSSELISEPTSA